MKNPIGQYPGYLLRIVSQKYMGLLAQRLGELDLRISEATVLLFIQNNPGVRQSQIGKQINIARANMAPLVGKLEKRGYVSKEPIDGRSFGLFLTENGKAITSKVSYITMTHEKDIENAIPDNIKSQFLETLAELSKSNDKP